MTANTSTAPVLLDDERSIRDGEIAATAYAKSGRESLLPMARGLIAARRKYRSNQEFGHWFDQSSYPAVVTNHTMRAALIYIGEHDDIAAPIIKNSRSVDPEAIAATIEEIRSLSGNLKTTGIGEPAEHPQNVVPIAPPAQTATALVGRTSLLRVSKRSWLYGRQRGPEVQAIYQEKNTRAFIGKIVSGRGGNDLWEMILTAIDEGFLRATDYSAHGASGSHASLRLLFPHNDARLYCRGIDLSTPQAIKRVRDFILPMMVANKDAILANPSQIGQIMNRAEYDARVKANEAAAVARLTERRAAMPTHEHQVVMYGEVFWPNPRPEVTAYTYDQCRAACWYFYETDQLYKVTAGGGDDVKGRAMMMRFSTRWFSQYADREMSSQDRDRIKRVFQLVHAMANAMEQNPTGTSSRPPSPTTDGEWP